MSWLDGDLEIFAAGLAVGGEWNSPSGNIAFVPLLWNDEGQYKYFYIGFKKAIKGFSFGQFNSSIKILGMNGPIVVSSVEKVGASTVKVVADISEQAHGVQVVGNDNSWIEYLNGVKIPAFSGTFYVAGLDSYTDLAYLFDSVNLEQTVYLVPEKLSVKYTGVTLEQVGDSVRLTPTFRVTDKVSIAYWKVD